VLGRIDRLLTDQVDHWARATAHAREQDRLLLAGLERGLGDLLARSDAAWAERANVIQAATADTGAVRESLILMSERLERLLQAGRSIEEMERSLAANLETLHETQRLDAVLNSLTAAVATLAARHPPRPKLTGQAA
jgi:hypothetical protein